VLFAAGATDEPARGRRARRYRAWLETYVRELNRRDAATGPWLLPLLLLATLRARPAAGQTAPAPPARYRRRAADHGRLGAQFLLKHQNRDAAASRGAQRRQQGRPWPSPRWRDVASAAGHLPDCSPNAEAVERAIDWLVRTQQPGKAT
jgi:hypothetical protein